MPVATTLCVMHSSTSRTVLSPPCEQPNGCVVADCAPYITLGIPMVCLTLQYMGMFRWQKAHPHNTCAASSLAVHAYTDSMDSTLMLHTLQWYCMLQTTGLTDIGQTTKTHTCCCPHAPCEMCHPHTHLLLHSTCFDTTVATLHSAQALWSTLADPTKQIAAACNCYYRQICGSRGESLCGSEAACAAVHSTRCHARRLSQQLPRW